MKRPRKMRTPHHTRLNLDQEKYYRLFIEGYLKISSGVVLESRDMVSISQQFSGYMSGVYIADTFNSKLTTWGASVAESLSGWTPC